MRIPVLLVALVCCFYNVNSQISIIPEKHVDSLIDLAYTDTLYYFQKIDFGKKALSYAKAIQYKNGIFNSNMATGICYLNLNDYEKTLSHFQDALIIAQDLDSLRYKAFANYYLGNVHNYLEHFDQSLNYFNKSLTGYEKLDNKMWMGIVKNGIGVVYSKFGEAEKGLAAWQAALDIFEANDMERESAVPIGNMGEYYFNLGQFELALYYYQTSLNLDRKYQEPKGEALSLANVGLAKRALKNYEEAFIHFEEGLSIAQEHQFNSVIYAIYKDIADTYSEVQNHEQSLFYYEKYVQLKDSILNLEVKEEIAKLQIAFDAKSKEQELAKKEQEIIDLKQKQKISQLTNILTFGGLVVISLIAYLYFSKHKTKRKLIQAELKAKELEHLKLQKELDFKSKDLTNFALDISRKNEFSDKLYAGLKDLTNTETGKIKTKARELLLMTANHLKINEDFEQFQMNVEKVNQDFFDKLNTQFPDLTVNEKHLCGLIRLNLSTKDIASIKNISPKSVEMGRYRLRKKLALQPNEEISVFLQKL